MSDMLIDIQQASYTYPGRASRTAPAQPVVALRDIRLQVAQGEYVALLGHNGSGKSTLARLCNALLVPQSGRVLVAGLDTRMLANQRAIRDRVGMIFQNPDNQIIATVVQDDVAWALAVRGLPADLIRERVGWALAAVGIADLGGRAPHKLSGGQRQRLAIAGALALRPNALITDEATAMLDPLARQEIMALLGQLNLQHGITIIHATHLLDEAVAADRIVALEQGRVVLDASPSEVVADLARLQQLRLAIPAPIELAVRLRAAGLAIDPAALTIEAIAAELERLL